MPIHTVKQGDCLSGIAETYGFFWETLWNHAENARLRDLRANPNVLLPGDKVFVPSIRPKDESGETASIHTFRLKGIPARLVFRLFDEEGAPRAGLAYSIEVDGKIENGFVPEDGMIDHVISPKAKKAKLIVKDPEGDEEYDFDLGYLNPVEDTLGVKSRLANLGFYYGNLDSTLDEETKAAIRAFQESAGLPLTGELDTATREALRHRHDN